MVKTTTKARKRGGARPGAGRPKGSKAGATKHRQAVENALATLKGFMATPGTGLEVKLLAALKIQEIERPDNHRERLKLLQMQQKLLELDLEFSEYRNENRN